MRLAFVADVHLGNHARCGGQVRAGINERCQLVLNTLRRALAKAREAEVREVYVLGDLFDRAAPSPQLIAATQHLFEESGCNVSLLLGNHEMVSTAEEDSALAPLWQGSEVISKPMTVGIGDVAVLWLVPFQPGAAVDWLPRVLAAEGGPYPERLNILALHLGISDDNTPPWLQGAHDSVPLGLVRGLADRYGFELVVAGNWHERRLWEYMTVPPGRITQRILQVGALCPTGWDNPGVTGYGTLAIYDIETRKLTTEEIPGPRFVDVSSRKELDALFALRGEYQWFVRWKTDAAGIAEVRQTAETLTLESGVLRALEPLLKEPERSKAQAAGPPIDSLDAGVSAFVAEMELQPGVDRAEVLAETKRFLGIG